MVHLRADRRGFLTPKRLLNFITLGCFGRVHWNLVVSGGVRKEGLQAVVIGMRDGIELMRMAAGASVGHRHERRTNGIGDVVQNFLAALLKNARVTLIGVISIEGRCDPGLWIVRPQFVARDLFFYETIVGLVIVKRFDHVVAITPRILPRFVALEAFTFGVTRYIEPVAAPSLPIMRRSQQAVYNLVVSFGRLVRDKSINFFRRWRQPRSNRK